MTFEEAKKILEKEFAVINLHKSTEPFEFDDSNWFGYEKPSVLEAFRVLSKEGYYITISGHDYDMRKKRLEKEYEKNTKDPGPGEEQPKEGDLKAATKMFGAQAREIMRLKAENAELRETIDKMKEGNPALEESASQFNDALLNEQGKKIAELTMENERLKDQVAVLDVYKKHNDKINRKQIKCLGKEIARLNKIIHKKNLKIEELRKESSRHLRGKIKDKDAILADVAEELRLSKIREKNLTELCQKYIKANEELKEKLADKVVDKINAQALKSAESALAYKDSYIEKLKNKKVINNRASMEAIAKYVDAVSKAELDGLVLVSWKNDGKEITSVYQLKNGKRYTLSLVYTGEEFLFYKTDLDKKRHISTPEISQEELMKIQEKVVASYDIAEEGADHSGAIVLCGKGITISKEEAKIIERCTKNGTELHYSEKDGLTYTNMYGEEMPIKCLRGLFHIFTDEELKKNEKVRYASK